MTMTASTHIESHRKRVEDRHPIYSTCSVGGVKIIVMVMVIIRKSKELAV